MGLSQNCPCRELREADYSDIFRRVGGKWGCSCRRAAMPRSTVRSLTSRTSARWRQASDLPDSLRSPRALR
jgi:hypothetical protein